MSRREKCIVCEGGIYRDGMHNPNKEKRKGITCSRKCSKVYERTYHYITQKLRYDKLKADSIMSELKDLLRNARGLTKMIANLIVKYG